MSWRVFLRFLYLLEKEVVEDEKKFRSMALRTTREEYFVLFLRFLSVE